MIWMLLVISKLVIVYGKLTVALVYWSNSIICSRGPYGEDLFEQNNWFLLIWKWKLHLRRVCSNLWFFYTKNCSENCYDSSILRYL